MKQGVLRVYISVFCLLAFSALLLGVSACQSTTDSQSATDEANTLQIQNKSLEELQTAYFAGGCFWCTEADFEKLTGVYEAISGFAGGEIENPAYKAVASGQTKHVEAVVVYYDETIVSYKTLVEFHLRHHDATDDGGQFADRGYQYSPHIFYQSQSEQDIAQAVIDDYQQYFEKPIVTQIREHTTFYEAEENHQDYYKKNSVRYNTYRTLSGRDAYLTRWDDIEYETDDNMEENQMDPKEKYKEQIAQLSPLQYKVTQEAGTEPAFTEGNMHDSIDEGIYVDIVSGEPLFSSIDKFDSGTGWPSFTKPIHDDAIVNKTDFKLIFPRTEVRSVDADSHLGHVFKDGPKDKGGYRYCMNGAAMRFVPKDKLEEEGYSEYLKLFQ